MKKGILLVVGCTLLATFLLEIFDFITLDKTQHKVLYFSNFLFVVFMIYYKKPQKF